MKNIKRLFSIIMVFIMTVTMIPMSAFAAESYYKTELFVEKTSESTVDVKWMLETGGDAKIKTSNTFIFKYDNTIYDLVDNNGEIIEPKGMGNNLFSSVRDENYKQKVTEVVNDTFWHTSGVFAEKKGNDTFVLFMLATTITDIAQSYPQSTSLMLAHLKLKNGKVSDKLPGKSIAIATMDEADNCAQSGIIFYIDEENEHLLYTGESHDTIKAPVIKTGEGVVFDKQSYTGINASKPAVSQKNGGNVVLTSQTIDGEQVEYAYGKSQDEPTSNWQDSNEFKNLGAGEYYFFARVKETDDHKAGKSVVSDKITVFAKPQIESYSKTDQNIVVDNEIKSMQPTVIGGKEPYNYSLNGALPQGLNFDQATGTISGTPTIATESETTVTITVTDEENITSNEYSLEIPAINKQENTMTKVTQADVVYNGASTLVNPVATSNGAAPKFSYKLQGAADSSYTDAKPTKVGKYTVRAVSEGHAKVKDKTVTASFEITQKTLTVDYSGITAIVKNYDGTKTAGTITGQATVEGISGDDVGVETTAGEYDSETAGVNKNITLTFLLTGNDKDNYQLEQTTYNFNKAEIKKVTPTYQIPAKQIKVGSTLSAFTAVAGDTATGVNNEPVKGTVKWYSDAARTTKAADSDVSNLVVGANITLYWTFTPDSQNYNAVSGQTEFTIVEGDPQNISFDDDDVNKTYGDAPFVNAVSNKTNDGAAINDGGNITWTSSNTSVATVADDGEVTIIGVGEATITATAAAVPGKYAQGSKSYTLIVAKKTLTPSITGAETTKEYDGTTNVNGTPAISLDGVVTGDTITATADFAYDTKDITAKSIKATNITLAGAKVANYELSAAECSIKGSITAKQLNITGVSAATRPYNGAKTVELTGGSLTGVIDSEVVSFNLGNGTVASADAEADKAVTTAITLTGEAAANYTLVQPADLKVTITPKQITIDGVTAESRTYDGTDTVTLADGSLTGICDGDTIGFELGKGTLADKNIGSDKAVTTAITLTGSKAANYALTQPAGLKATITARQLTVSGAKASDREFDDTFNVTITGGELQNAVAGDDVTLETTAAAGTIADKNIGTDKQVTVTGYAISGDDAANYTLAQPTDVKVNINKKLLTIKSATVEDKPFDGNKTAKVTAVEFNGTPVPDAAGYTATAEFKDANAADDKTVIVKVVLNDKNYRLESNTIEVAANITKAAAVNVPTQTLILKAGDQTEQQIDLTRLMPADAGKLTYDVPALTGDDIVDIAKTSFENGIYKFALIENAGSNKTQTIKVTVTSDNYQNTELTIELKTTDKQIPEVTVNDITASYTGNAVTINGKASVAGTFAWATGTAAPTAVAHSGSYEVVFTPDDDTYATVTKTIRVTITPAKITGTIDFAKVTEAGKTLGEIKPNSFDKLNVTNGTFTWNDGDAQIIEQGKSYGWTFTPDNANYEALKGTVTPWAASGGSGGGGGGILPPAAEKPEITVDNTKGKIELSADGTTAIITPNEGYEIDKVTVNGKETTITDNKITGLKTGDKVVVTFKAKATEPEFNAKSYVKELKIVARSVKTSKGNIKVTVNTVTDKDGNVIDLAQLKDKGYTVKYKFYRSTKKASKYAATVEKSVDNNSYVNTTGKKGTKYYYKVRVVIYDNNGQLVAKSELKQCKYASRTWSK